MSITFNTMNWLLKTFISVCPLLVTWCYIYLDKIWRLLNFVLKTIHYVKNRFQWKLHNQVESLLHIVHWNGDVFSVTEKNGLMAVFRKPFSSLHFCILIFKELKDLLFCLCFPWLTSSLFSFATCHSLRWPNSTDHAWWYGTGRERRGDQSSCPGAHLRPLVTSLSKEMWKVG